jgi:hypothetical protein
VIKFVGDKQRIGGYKREFVMDSMRDKQVLIIGLTIIYFILTVEKNTELKGM